MNNGWVQLRSNAGQQARPAGYRWIREWQSPLPAISMVTGIGLLMPVVFGGPDHLSIFLGVCGLMMITVG